ncbi:hypothetical protein H2200_009456 [Cladophialophora chaetospira]|uniref:Uncharacterized protein n=1 Tax=Cladophialophora chaetospira TaxID=386627 RepID=A0AA38X494_9EURO|nr:hypothetical protein H2200_009456 [Cladophialophora chaetospira]
MSSLTKDSTEEMPTSLLQSPRFEDRARAMHTAFAKVDAFMNSKSCAEPLTEEETQSISLSYSCMLTGLRRHLDRLHEAILQHPAFTMKGTFRNLDLHWSVSRSLSCIRELTFRLGTSQTSPRKHKEPKPVLEYPVLLYCAVMKMNATHALHNLHLIETSLLKADFRRNRFGSRVAGRKAAFAMFKHSMMQVKYMVPESCELLAHLGLDGIVKEFLTIGDGRQRPQSSVLAPAPTTSPPEPEDPATHPEQQEEQETCFICWTDATDIPVFWEPRVTHAHFRPQPANLESTGPEAIIHLGCCRAGFFHKACLFRTIKPEVVTGLPFHGRRPTCGHCQKPIPVDVHVKLIEWQTREFVRQTERYRLLMLEDQAKYSCA